MTCLNQYYPNYHAFLLDVSTNLEMRRLVDDFHKEFASATTLIRLQPRQGFKARSLNNALKTAVSDDYEFFAVCDADNYWPPDFLSRATPYFLLDERVAFIQVNHIHSGHSQRKFAQDFEIAIDASWYLHQPPRGRYGLLMCIGHSVAVRRQAWAKVGGYPEIIQEDTTFTKRLREHGYFGCFAKEIICGEEFPEDFDCASRRQFRLVQADTDILFTQANGGTLSATSLDTTFSSMLAPSLITITLLTATAPFYPFFVYLKRQPLKLPPLLFRSIMLYSSFLDLAITSLVVYLLRGRAMFLVTGSKNGAAIQSQPTGMYRRFLQRLNADSPVVILLDISSALILGYVCIATDSLVLLGVTLVLLLSPMIHRYGWDKRAISIAVYLPLALIIAGLVTSLSGGTGAQSQYLALAVLSVLLF